MSNLNSGNQLSVDEGLNSGSTTQPPPTGNGDIRYSISPPIHGAAGVVSNRHSFKNNSSSSSVWENLDENSAPTIKPKIIINQYENSPKHIPNNTL